jgi:hypothetical protein
LDTPGGGKETVIQIVDDARQAPSRPIMPVFRELDEGNNVISAPAREPDDRDDGMIARARQAHDGDNVMVAPACGPDDRSAA